MKNNCFSKEFMENYTNSLTKEYLITNGKGAFCASTIGGCNTRKYHGLFIIPQPQIDNNDHVIVSSLDEQVVYKQNTFQLATHKYPGTIHPEGFKNITSFICNPLPKWTFTLADCVITKEILMPEDEDCVLIRYTVEEASEKVQLNLFPFLSFRNSHELKRANLFANKKTEEAINGISARLYFGYESVFIQTSIKSEFIYNPDWYYNIEYPVEQNRGYPYTEDLFVPGNFCLNLNKGDKIIVSVGINECNPKTLNTRFTTSFKKLPLIDSEHDCLVYAAKQFVVKQDNEIGIKAGYHWFGNWGRDTFIAMPGLLLTNGKIKEFKAIINSSILDLKKGLLPNIGRGKNAVYNSVDASLWFIWAIQQYAIFTNTQDKIWKEYGEYLNQILEYYLNGTLYNIHMDKDGLITAGQAGVALTWMDAIVNGKPVTPRTGKAVEINALWYNAICFCIETAKLANDKNFVDKWQNYPSLIRQSFMETFWDKEKQYLADCENNGIIDWSIRPNQVFALSMPYSPVAEYARRPILDLVVDELLTLKGLRTLSHKDVNYKGECEGNQEERDNAYHQGTVWPWLLGHFADAYIKEYDFEGKQVIQEILGGLSEMLDGTCINTIPEIYNGDYPHKQVGAVAQAWSVGEFLRIEYLLNKYNEKEKVYQSGIV